MPLALCLPQPMGPAGGIGTRVPSVKRESRHGTSCSKTSLKELQRRTPLYRAPPEPSAARQREWKPDASPPGFFFRNIATMREVRV